MFRPVAWELRKWQNQLDEKKERKKNRYDSKIRSNMKFLSATNVLLWIIKILGLIFQGNVSDFCTKNLLYQSKIIELGCPWKAFAVKILNYLCSAESQVHVSVFTSKNFGSCQKSKQTLCLNVTALHSLVNKKLPKHYKISHHAKFFGPQIYF